MPDASGKFKGISLSGKAGAAHERIFGVRGDSADEVCDSATKARRPAKIVGFIRFSREGDTRP